MANYSAAAGSRKPAHKKKKKKLQKTKPNTNICTKRSPNIFYNPATTTTTTTDARPICKETQIVCSLVGALLLVRLSHAMSTGSC
jgi:hypothetical protein